MSEKNLRVLFLCTGNSARSQMAEAVLRHMSHGRVETASAGTEPKDDVHPMARVTIGRMYHDELREQSPKHVDRFMNEEFDYVITVCDRAAEHCPVLPGDPNPIHWSFEDPAAVDGPPEVQQRAFDRIAGEIAARIRTWMALPAVRERL